MSEAALRFPVLLSILAAILTLVLKGVSYYLTDSISLLSDALESMVNLLAAGTAYLSLWYASQPADPTHTYGHKKIEYFSSGLEGVLILVAAGGIAWYAARRLIVPEPLKALDIGTLLSGAAAVVNLAVAQLLLRVGRAHHSIVLEADGKHLMTDVFTSAGVLGGLGIIWLGKHFWQVEMLWIDPVVALLMAANITWTGCDLVRRSFNGLMDHALPQAEQIAIRAAIEAQLEPGMAYHALRTRQAGTNRFADCHLLVPGQLTVQRAHQVADRIEQAVEQTFPGMEVTVHIEPIEERASWHDSEVLSFEEMNQHRPEGGS